MRHFNAINLKTFYESILKEVKVYTIFGEKTKKKEIDTKDLNELIKLKEEHGKIISQMKKETQLNKRVALGKKRKEIMKKIEKLEKK